jgi:multidrug efflux pump subunit AcrA (membrane-fusion protein)
MKVEKLEKNISLASLTSPADGLVLIEELWDEKFKVGKEVPLAYTIINLPDISNLQVVGWVHEVDSPKVQLGQTARVTMDAHPDTKVDATVVKVASLAVTRGDHDERYLRVVLELAETLPKMKPGMTVETDLLVRSLTDAVLIPSEAVFPSPEGPVVYVDDGQAKSVTILATDGTRTAVEGVDPGTSVWTVSADSWTPGGPS